MRLDQYLAEQGLAPSRNKAQELIKAGKVRIGGAAVLKPSFDVAENDTVEVESEGAYVSRAAYKLKGFLDETGFSPDGMEALDVGASTGGFTQVLLEYGAAHVTALDVGTAQLCDVLRSDARVTSVEQTDIRSYAPGKRFELIVGDVAFISLLHILDALDALASKWLILLFKPQFEVGKEVKRDGNGVVKDQKAIDAAMMRFEDACMIKGWRLQEKRPSKLSGKEGNIEYCYCFRKD